MSKRRILVTSALPYANGAIHLGHLVEYIQTDIWVRFQKMCGHEVHYVCADDTHGTPIMLKADSEGVTPEALIAKVSQEHQRDFAGFLIGFDHYGSTNSQENKTLSENIYLALQQQGLIEVRPVEQYFDPVKNMFLPDRFIKGTCPKCGAQHQYGDSCESCGATYSPTDLINPYSTVSGAAPIRKSSDHYFFKLSDPRCEQFLREWTQTDGRLQPEAARKMQEWLGSDGDGKLSDWDISRDAPYFGFEIPNAPGKFFYVWLDAPVGYFASFLSLCQNIGLDPKPYLQPDDTTEMVHFIGKDILYFHALFWPAMLKFSGYRTPSQINAHGFLTVNGAKMSKSRGTFITAQSYLDEKLNPEWLRYYFAAKLNSSIEDIDLNFSDFTARVNSDLIGKFINIASRSSGFIHKRFEGLIHPDAANHPLVLSIQQQSDSIKSHYNAREFSRAVRDIMHCADMVNAFVDEQKPWDLAKAEGQSEALQLACSVCLECFRMLSLYLAPILPKLTQQVEALLGCNLNSWDSVQVAIKTDKPIAPFKHIMQRLEPQQIERLVAVNAQHLNNQN